jgi:prefoldin subunit 5
VDPADELEALTAQAADLQAELEAMQQRIEQLRQDPADA